MAKNNSFYDELVSRGNPVEKVASEKGNHEILKGLEELGHSKEKIEVLAEEVRSLFSKQAEEITPIEGVKEDVNTLQATLEAALGAANEIEEEVGAIEAAEPAAGEEIVDVVAPAPAEEVAEVPAEEVAETSAEEVAEVPAEEVAEVPAEEIVVDDATVAADPEVVAEEEEVDKAAFELAEFIKTASDEEKEEFINNAYEKIAADMATNGLNLYDYVEPRVQDEEMAASIVETSEKLAYLSGQSYYKVADDILYEMDKVLESIGS